MQHSAAHSLSVVLVKKGLWLGVVQQGEAQNNDCLFVVIFIGADNCPPPPPPSFPLKMHPDTQASVPAHTCTHLGSHRNASTRAILEIETCM